MKTSVGRVKKDVFSVWKHFAIFAVEVSSPQIRSILICPQGDVVFYVLAPSPPRRLGKTIITDNYQKLVSIIIIG